LAASNLSLTPERWAQIAEVYRKHGPRHVVAANELGVDYRTARKYYEVGAGPKYPPIRDICDKFGHIRVPDAAERASDTVPQSGGDDAPRYPTEAPQITAAVLAEIVDPPSPEEEVYRVIDELKRGFAKTLEREASMAAGLREVTIGTMLFTSKIMQGYEPVAERIKARLMEMASKGEIKKTTWALTYLDRLVKIQGQTLTNATRAVELQRLIMGMPQSITEGRVKTHSTITDATAEADKLRHAMDRLKDYQTKRKALQSAIAAPPDEDPDPYVGASGGQAGPNDDDTDESDDSE
jgi:hypothetical protein